jgi:hypothetical protein
MKDVESEHYNKIREFFAIETNAFLLSSAMVYFGMSTMNSMPSKNIFPSKLTKSSVTEKRKWLYAHIGKLYDLYVSGSVNELSHLGDVHKSVGESQKEKATLPCRFSGFSADFLTLFRLNGCHKYTLAGLRLIPSIEGLLTPRKAHQLTWNRFAGVKQGAGKRISRDERLEQLNKVSKEEIRSLGFPNINDENVVKATRATGPVDKLIKQLNADLIKRVSRSGHHCKKRATSVLSTILKQIHNKAKVFQIQNGREYRAFPKLKQGLFKQLHMGQLGKWIKMYKTSWHRQNHHIYKMH